MEKTPGQFVVEDGEPKYVLSEEEKIRYLLGGVLPIPIEDFSKHPHADHFTIKLRDIIHSSHIPAFVEIKKLNDGADIIILDSNQPVSEDVEIFRFDTTKTIEELRVEWKKSDSGYKLKLTPHYQGFHSLSSKDIENYTRHGLIRIKVKGSRANKRKIDIDLERLVETYEESERPSHIVIKRTAGDEAPEIQIANPRSTKPKNRPKNTYTLDPSKVLKILRVEWPGIHPSKPYENVIVTPFYRD